MARKNKQLGEQIRDAIDQSGMSWYRVSQETGITETTVSRFMRGIVDLRLSNAEKLMDLLGMQVAQKSKKKKQR